MFRVRSARVPLALLLSVAVGASSCATAGGRVSTVAGPPEADPAIGEFAQKLPPGSAVLIERRLGKRVSAILLKATPDHVVVQPRTRLPEPPIDIPMADIVRLQPESPNGRSIGKAIGVGAAAGASAALGVFFILLAIFSD